MKINIYKRLNQLEEENKDLKKRLFTDNFGGFIFSSDLEAETNRMTLEGKIEALAQHLGVYFDLKRGVGVEEMPKAMNVWEVPAKRKSTKRKKKRS